MTTQPNFYNIIISSLDQTERDILSKNFVEAQKQYTEYLKMKEEEANLKK